MRIIYKMNGKGFVGSLVNLPAAYFRGRIIKETSSKIEREIRAYKSWLENKAV
ncbi:MAG TPA: hypothetical protein PLE76_05830 [Rectinema sp.]|jgi:hypothetical protein|nr:hypothetical protein [Spirochaetota bacterium]NLH88939.1 hypothetical protein [Treponema sp.]HNZ93046.1 hypothetical protein [Rectinema sp.]HOC27272.1 hypothetical protein [Rectinema sp.]HOH16688.1 hypothetical protein [Rectinema sp.]